MEKGSPLIGRSWIPPSPHEEKNIDKSSQFNIRCTAEQKELFQKAIANSGKSGAEFIQEAIESSKLKFALDPMLASEVDEADQLLARLTRLVHSRLYQLSEKENQIESMKETLSSRKTQIEQETQEYLNKLDADLNDAKDQLQKNILIKEQELIEKFEAKEKIFEQDIISLREQNELFESKLSLFQKESDELKKQNTSHLNHISTLQERNDELKYNLDVVKREAQDMKNELIEFKKVKDSLVRLQQENVDLKHKMELEKLRHEKDLEKAEGEFKLKLLGQAVSVDTASSILSSSPQ